MIEIGGKVVEPKTVTVTPGNGTVIEIPGVKEETVWMTDYYGKELPSEGTFAETLRSQFAPKVIHRASVETVLKTPVQSKLIGAVHQCYDRHLPLALSPEVIWYAILHEIAIQSKQCPAECAHLFTMKPSEVQTVEVRDDSLSRYDGDWGRTLPMFDAALRPLVPEGSMETFLPKFSTSTPDADISLLLAFMDAASPYFAYRVSTMCGIPRIRLNGTSEDWKTIARNTQTLSERVPGLESWFTNLLPVLQKLHAATEGEQDLEFWNSIYKISGGSGGPYISGWITALSAFTYTYKKEVVRKHPQLEDWRSLINGRGFGGMTTDAFLPHLSSIPFVWNYMGNEIPMTLVSGVAGLSLTDGFYTPLLGWAVLENGGERPAPPVEDW